MARLTGLLIVLALLAPTFAGCQSAYKATDPEGGFAAFRAALLAREPEQIWFTLSSDTHELFDEVLRSLAANEDMIQQLQPSDREEARTAMGGELLDRMESSADLFAWIFAQENVPTETGFDVGLRVRSVEMDGDDRALITTRAGQEIEMVREEDGLWRVRSPLHEQFASAFAVMEENRAALEAAINLFGAAANEDAEIARLLGLTSDAAPAEQAAE